MSAEPLTREERDDIAYAWTAGITAEQAFRRIEATVQAVEERAERLRAALDVIHALPPDAPEEAPYEITGRALAADDAARGEG